MDVMQEAADGTATIEDIKMVVERLHYAPENWLSNLSNNLESCVSSVSASIYSKAETVLYTNENLFQYQFGEAYHQRIDWIAHWICSGATFGCASFNPSACPQAHTCFAPIYQYFASFLSYSGGSAFGNYQNLNTGRITPMYSPDFIAHQLVSNVKQLASWKNAYESFQIYLNAMHQIKEGSTFNADAFDATMQVESVSTSVSLVSSYSQGKHSLFGFNYRFTCSIMTKVLFRQSLLQTGIIQLLSNSSNVENSQTWSCVLPKWNYHYC